MIVELLKITAQHAVIRYNLRCLDQMFAYYSDEDNSNIDVVSF